jgi:hypothetical protein
MTKGWLGLAERCANRSGEDGAKMGRRNSNLWRALPKSVASGVAV